MLALDSTLNVLHMASHVPALLQAVESEGHHYLGM